MKLFNVVVTEELYGGEPVGVGCIKVSTAAKKDVKNLNAVLGSSLRSDVQRCVLAVVYGVHVRAGLDEQRDDGQVGRGENLAHKYSNAVAGEHAMCKSVSPSQPRTFIGATWLTSSLK